MKIIIDDLKGQEIIELLTEHLRHLAAITPSESMHALDLDKLRAPNITFWSVWEGGVLAGCGALKELDAYHGEIKSMRTNKAFLRKGVASLVLQTIFSEANRRDYTRLSLETGSSDNFKPAHALYHKFGFTPCGPFGDYREDPNSVFMTMEL